jgi:hypothetical protein
MALRSLGIRPKCKNRIQNHYIYTSSVNIKNQKIKINILFFVLKLNLLNTLYTIHTMEIITGEDGIRRRKTIDVNGKKRLYKLCTGQGNTCVNDAKANDLCKGCVTGVYKFAADEHVEGDKFEENGIRYIFTSEQRRKLCNGKDNTCEKLVRSGGKCAGCASGREKAPIDGLIVGAIVERDDTRSKFDGKQLRKLCSGDENKCLKYATTKGQCVLHANGGIRQKTAKE